MPLVYLSVDTTEQNEYSFEIVTAIGSTQLLTLETNLKKRKYHSFFAFEAQLIIKKLNYNTLSMQLQNRGTAVSMALPGK
jgi:hypothetical protein